MSIRETSPYNCILIKAFSLEIHSCTLYKMTAGRVSDDRPQGHASSYRRYTICMSVHTGDKPYACQFIQEINHTLVSSYRR